MPLFRQTVVATDTHTDTQSGYVYSQPVASANRFCCFGYVSGFEIVTLLKVYYSSLSFVFYSVTNVN